MTDLGAPVLTGLDILCADEEALALLRRSSVAVLTHAAAVTLDDVHLYHALSARGVRFRRIFSPEHGLWAQAQDMIACDDVAVDPVLGEPVRSLYGSDEGSLRLPVEELASIDILLIDLQDVGSRYYTYVASACYAYESALAAGVACWVLDRPNPIDGVTLEGNVVADGFSSFVSALRVPNRHGMTLAELVRFYIDDALAGDDSALRVFRMRGWDRRLQWDRLGRSLVLPSPNMPTLATMRVYPGQCLLEGTNLSEGRGTTKPFEIFGAPWLNLAATQEAFDLFKLPGVRLRPLAFVPQFQKHAGQVCRGFELIVTEPDAYHSLRTSIVLLSIIFALHSEFKWRDEAYEFVENVPAIDLLFGTDWARQAIEGQQNPLKITAKLDSRGAAFRAIRERYLIY